MQNYSFAKRENGYLMPRKPHTTDVILYTFLVGFKNFRFELKAIYQLNSKQGKIHFESERGK